MVSSFVVEIPRYELSILKEEMSADRSDQLLRY